LGCKCLLPDEPLSHKTVFTEEEPLMPLFDDWEDSESLTSSLTTSNTVFTTSSSFHVESTREEMPEKHAENDKGREGFGDQTEEPRDDHTQFDVPVCHSVEPVAET